MRRLIAHYAPAQADDRALIERLLSAIRKPAAGLFESVEPVPERYFVGELRQMVVGALEAAEPDITVDLVTVSAALEPLTVTEKHAAWLETMRYTPQHAAAMLRISDATVERIRVRAAELVRGKVDRWRRTLLAENGAALGRDAASASTADCLPSKAFLDILDGRTTWAVREQVDRHVTGCLHCIDHFCRMMETIELGRGVQALADSEAEQLGAPLGLAPGKRRLWKRIRGG
jgi:hypothetical protein